MLTPDCSINTAEIFNAEQLTRNTPAITIAAFLQGGSQIATRNDCQPVVEQGYPAVKNLLEWLSTHAPASQHVRPLPSPVPSTLLSPLVGAEPLVNRTELRIPPLACQDI